VADVRDINFDWLLRLRWGVIAGQATVLLLAQLLLDVALPLAPLLAIILVESASNALCWRWARGAARAHIADWMLGALMALDIATFTLILWLTGGPVNPFSFLYLVYIALAAVVLPGRRFASQADACDAFIAEMTAMVHRMPFAQTLRAVGVAESDLDRLAADAMKVERLLINNPRPVTLADARAIYASVL